MDDWAVMRHLRNDNGISWVCRHCDDPFPWDVHPDSIRQHLTWDCESVPEEVKEAAQRRVVESAECSRSVEGSDSNLRAKTETSRNAGMEVEATECSRSVNCEPMIILDASENNDSNFEAEMERSSVERRKKMRITEDAPLTKFLVGDAFRRNVEHIWSWLMDDQVLRVGICGMGGVGKTTLMRYIQTRLKAQSSFEVYWITVSEDFSIWKLQDLIAKKIGLRFNNNEDVRDRAEKITQSLEAKGNYVLILDDLWDSFDANGVGIQVGVNTGKLVLTSRLLEVCRQMGCSEGNTIHVQVLSEEEAWILFTQKLGNYSIEVEELAKAVSRHCAGLPLGITVMAKYMKKNCNLDTWRNMVEEFKESKVSRCHEMREKVFSVLKFSYFQLNDPALRECLSYCTLFPEDDKIDRNELIEYMIVEGIIDERRSRKAEIDKGHTMLDTLENACLLEGDTRFVWMHDLIRDMVILESREGSNTLVKAGVQLKTLPDVENWTENLVRVSLISNDIKEIPADHTTKCPNLSTLLLCRNHGLKMIAGSFFDQFQNLKILDLSCCDAIEGLPHSISDLVNLTALLLRYCWRLTYVPSLARLRKLEKLDLRHCEMLECMPEGMGDLVKLKYLDLSGTGIKMGGSRIIAKLSQLQVLKLYDEYGHSDFSMSGYYVGYLTRLETLYCIFSNISHFVDYMNYRVSLSDYSILVQSEYPYWKTSDYSRKLGSRKSVTITSCSIRDCLTLPADVEALHIYNCSSPFYMRLFSPTLLAHLVNLQDICVENWYDIHEIFARSDRGGGEFPFFNNPSIHSSSNHSLLNLKIISIEGCHKLKELFPPSLLANLHNLQTILVRHCNEMEEIFSTDKEEDRQELLCDQPNLTGLHLPGLTILELRDLPELRSIYNGPIICHSLQEIQLVDCPKLKRITLPLPQPSLQTIQVYPKQWWDSVQWGSANVKNHLETFVKIRRRNAEGSMSRLPSVSEQDSLEVEAEVSSIQCSNKRQREGNIIVQRSNKRQRRMPDPLPIAPEVDVLKAIHEMGESASITKLPVGDAFQKNMEKIWSWLVDEQVLRVGICGMGGVGKTTLMRHIQTRMGRQSSLKVFWVTGSQDFSIWKLQDLIAKRIDLKFLDQEHEVERAEKLAQTLKARGKCVFMLDDLCESFEMDKVGIPVGVDTCKLILTTRLLKVCRQMDCSEGNTIQVQPLSKGESWILFTQELDNSRTEVEELAKAVSRECAGLPLGIRVMARSMKGTSDVRTWRDILKWLKKSKFRKGYEMEEVFCVLKSSYLRLNDPALRECLSYCALFPEDDLIDRNELIEYMIVEGIIDERRSRKAGLDKGHRMLYTLENACLLEGDTRFVWMHVLIRDMVILELREESKTLVEAGAQLRELPNLEKWTEDVVRVSLMCNDIEVIPSSHTPRCPNLSTLLLCRNYGLKMIADSFFEQFQRSLKILDLTSCHEIEELPRSISNFVNLTALLLHKCKSLTYVPSLIKLEKLDKLDLGRCRKLKQMPEGVESLFNLTYLDVSNTGIEVIGSGIILGLYHLQVLKL